MTDPGFPGLTGQVVDLVIDGVSTNTAGWQTNYTPLLGGAAPRGSNVRISGQPGTRPYRRWPDETTHQLEMHITGARDVNGDAPDDPIWGLVTNIDYLLDNIVTDGEAATKPAVLMMRDGSTRTADIQVQLETAADTDGAYDISAVLFITIPKGRFVPVPAVTNDDWANAFEFDVAVDTVVTGDNTGFTVEDDEQMPSVADIVRSAWWKFTAPSDGTVDLDTNDTPFDTVLAVWTGASLAALVEEVSDDDGGIAPNSAVTFNATNGTTYYVQVTAFTSADPSEGPITLNVGFTP